MNKQQLINRISERVDTLQWFVIEAPRPAEAEHALMDIFQIKFAIESSDLSVEDLRTFRLDLQDAYDLGYFKCSDSCANIVDQLKVFARAMEAHVTNPVTEE